MNVHVAICDGATDYYNKGKVVITELGLVVLCTGEQSDNSFSGVVIANGREVYVEGDFRKDWDKSVFIPIPQGSKITMYL